MKKILILFFISLQLFFFNQSMALKLKAAEVKEEIEKNLICNVGTPQPELLEYDGFTIKTNNVNFYKCGSYQVVYENETTHQEVVKTVIVKSNDDLLNGTNFEVTKNICYKKEDNVTFHKVLKTDDDGYIISYIERVESGQEELFNIKLMKLLNKECLFDITIFSKAKGRIKDFIIDDGKIVLFVEKENEGSMQDVYFMVYDMNGSLLKERHYLGSKVDKALKILKDEDYYYLVGSTASTDDDYRFQHTKVSGYCMVINRITLEEELMYEATQNYDLTVVDAIINKGYLYIFATYYSTNESQKYTVGYIYRISQQELINVVNLRLGIAEDILAVTNDQNNQLYMATSDYDYETKEYIQNIYTLNMTCARTLLFDSRYEKEANANLIHFFVSPTQQMILLYDLYNDKEVNRYGYLYKVYQDNELLFSNESFSYNEAVSGLIENDISKIYKASTSTLSIDEISYLYLNYTTNQEVEKVENELQYPRLLIDAEEAKLDKEKSVIPIQAQLFGSYPVRYFFTSKNAIFSFSDTLYFLPYTNIVENETYDVNTCLLFNGKATLNQYQIDSGYAVTEPGDYTLEVKGVNDETHVVNFTIKKLSSSEEKYPPKIDGVVVKEIEIPKVFETVEYIHLLNEEDIVPKEKNNLWYLLIPLTFIGILSIVIKKR